MRELVKTISLAGPNYERTLKITFILLTSLSGILPYTVVMNKSVATLIAAKSIKHVTFVFYDGPFSGYVSKEVSNAYSISDGRISINAQDMQMTFLDADAEIIETHDCKVEIKIKGMRETVYLTW